MSIITISRGSYSKGREIAEKVAEELGYECIGRDMLLEASGQFDVPEIRLVRAIHDAPTLLERFNFDRMKYILYLQNAILRHVQKDNVVYHGLAGHFWLDGISHVLKVRVIADIGDRVAAEMERENISRNEALHVLEKDDEQRVKWSKSLYGIDTRDPSLYDMVLHIKRLNVQDVVKIICHTVKLEHFQTTPESQKSLDDRFLASEVKVALMEMKPEVEVSAKDGVVLVKTHGHLSHEEYLINEIRNIGETVEGVKKVNIDVLPYE